MRDLNYWHLVGRLDSFILGMLAARWYLRRNLAALNASLSGKWLEADRETVALQGNGDIWLDVEQLRRGLAACQSP